MTLGDYHHGQNEYAWLQSLTCGVPDSIEMSSLDIRYIQHRVGGICVLHDPDANHNTDCQWVSGDVPPGVGRRLQAPGHLSQNLGAVNLSDKAEQNGDKPRALVKEATC